MTAKELSNLLEINAKHSLYREDGRWYHHLVRFPGILFDKDGWVVFQTQQDYLNCAALRHGVELSVPKGISSIKGYQLFSEDQLRKLLITSKEDDAEEILKQIRIIKFRLRKVSLVAEIKALYNDTCQICGIRLEVGPNKYYSEAHHIRPLGHNGPDAINNMICVCPNHHVQLDLGSFKIQIEKFLVLDHKISSDHINYHNNIIWPQTHKGASA